MKGMSVPVGFLLADLSLSEQLGRADGKSHGQRLDHVKARVAVTPLYLHDVRPVQLRVLSQLFLGPPSFGPQLTHAVSEPAAVGCLLEGAGAGRHDRNTVSTSSQDRCRR
jgi:hypothetical protein